ncbi:MAG: hypothetical protein ABR502_07240 [Chitinophagaceae bacterium]
MQTGNKSNNGNKQGKEGTHEHPLPHEIPKSQRDINEAAHDQAEEDIAQDPDLSIHSPNDDLDEGETARLGEDKTDLV